MANGRLKPRGIYEHGFAMVPVCALRDRSLSKGAKLLYSFLQFYAGSGPKAFPSQKRLAEDMGITHQSVLRLVEELRLKGYITKESNEQGSSIVYTLPNEVIPVEMSEKPDTEPEHVRPELHKGCCGH